MNSPLVNLKLRNIDRKNALRERLEELERKRFPSLEEEMAIDCIYHELDELNAEYEELKKQG